MGIGAYLKQQRTLRDIELADVAKTTRIARQWLDAIEADQLDALPGRIFVRGYIKAYADCIGLNVNEVLLRFDDEYTQSHCA